MDVPPTANTYVPNFVFVSNIVRSTAAIKTIQKGFGTPRKLPLPMFVNSGTLFLVIVAAFVMNMVTDRAIIPTARVTINGGIWVLVIIIPFINPNPAATTMHRAIATHSGTAPEPCNSMSTVPDVANTAPLDKSIPPDMSTNVIPSEIIPIVDIFLKTALKLFVVANFSAIMAHTANTTTLYSFHTILKKFFPFDLTEA